MADNSGGSSHQIADDAEHRRKRQKTAHRSSLIKGILANDTVVLKIAGETKEFHVNKPLLCERSAFFAKAFQQDGMKESVEGRIELHDVSGCILEAFIYWVYTADFDLGTHSNDNKLISSADLTFLVKVYNFADVYDTLDLRNDVVRKIRAGPTTNGRSFISAAGTALDSLREDSKLYSLILEIVRTKTLRHSGSIHAICHKFPRAAMEVIFAKCILQTSAGPKAIEEYLESDPSK